MFSERVKYCDTCCAQGFIFLSDDNDDDIARCPDCDGTCVRPRPLAGAAQLPLPLGALTRPVQLALTPCGR